MNIDKLLPLWIQDDSISTVHVFLYEDREWRLVKHKVSEWVKQQGWPNYWTNHCWLIRDSLIILLPPGLSQLRIRKLGSVCDLEAGRVPHYDRSGASKLYLAPRAAKLVRGFRELLLDASREVLGEEERAASPE